MGDATKCGWSDETGRFSCRFAFVKNATASCRGPDCGTPSYSTNCCTSSCLKSTPTPSCRLRRGEGGRSLASVGADIPLPAALRRRPDFNYAVPEVRLGATIQSSKDP